MRSTDGFPQSVRLTPVQSVSQSVTVGETRDSVVPWLVVVRQSSNKYKHELSLICGRQTLQLVVNVNTVEILDQYGE